ncbi:MAG: alanine racemase [Crocinitomicaceae bacterium]
MFHTSHIELSKSAVKKNIDFIQNFLREGVTFSSVVKGNAYGHGIDSYCPLAHECGVRHFSFFSAQEALNVTQVLKNREFNVMIMGQIDNEELEWAIDNEIEFYVFEQDRLEAAIATAKEMVKKARIHVELETGMNRTGFSPEKITAVFELIEANLDFIDVKGICSHLAGAENIANEERVFDQFDRFEEYLSILGKYKWLDAKRHIASSAATLRYPNMQLDLVRIGILQFGFFPTEEIYVHYSAQNKTGVINPLNRILSWKSKVMDVETVNAGEFVGYGASYMTNQTTKVALLPVGYSFGYSRSLSNQGKVLINGARFDVIGTVNMSMLAVDITTDETIGKGDEAVLIGHQEESEITVSSFSDFSHLINYELLTRLPHDIPRLIKE